MNEQNEKDASVDARTQLYLSQVELLETFYARRAITAAQYNKSFRCMTEKMGMEEVAAARGMREKYE